MAANFLHGVETIEIDSGPRPVRLVKTAVIGIVGTAASGPVNTPTLVASERDFAQWGQDTAGCTILDALNVIYSQKGTVCVVVNVFDPERHASVQDVTATDIIGGIDAAGQRSGLKALRDSYALFGFYPKILIAPMFASLGSVAAELAVVASAIRAVAFVDAPVGVTPQQAITGRGSAGAINFNTSSDRIGLCYPHVQAFDTATNAQTLRPLSAFAAGAQSRKDQEKGYWWSLSNTELLGALGMERPIDAMINDPNSEANLLNEAGIITVFNSFGTGLRIWGNRSAAWPSSSGPKNFLCVRRVADIIAESLEYYTLQYIDRPLNNALIDAIVESCNAFIRKLKADGALIDGRAYFDPAQNEATSLASGHLTINYDFMPPTPTERVTYKAAIDINYLKQLGQE